MATVTTTLKGQDLRSALPGWRGDASIGGMEMVEVTYDGSLICSAANGYGAASDIFEVLDIPKNSAIYGVHVLLDTGASTPDVVEGGTSTINIGDTGSATRFDSARSTNAAINAQPFPAAALTPQFYSAADKLRIAVASGTLKKARFRIRIALAVYGS